MGESVDLNLPGVSRETVAEALRPSRFPFLRGRLRSSTRQVLDEKHARPRRADSCSRGCNHGRW